MKLTRKAFTLVELIIVIAIIAVLAVSAFMVLTKWLGKSRDSRRLGDVGAIERALSTWLSDYEDNADGTLPAFTASSAITANGIENVSSGGYFGNYFKNELKDDGFDVLQKSVSDPADHEYIVAVNDAGNNKYFSVAATLEKDGTAEAVIKQNYAVLTTGVSTIDSDWSGNSLIHSSVADAASGASMKDEGTATVGGLPYTLD